MNHKAALLALVLVSSSLAGCTGDPDAGGGDEFDSEALQDLIDENLQDFINNTSVTMYQEIHHHYHNNTTIDNTDNSVSNINGSGTGSGSIIQAFRVVWNPDDRLEPTDFGARDLVINGIVQVPGWSGSELSYQYNGNLIKLSFTCEEFVNAYKQMQQGGWGDWIFSEYGGSQSQADNLGGSIRVDTNEVYYGAEDGYCWDGYDIPYADYVTYLDANNMDFEVHYTTILEIPLSAGQAIGFMYMPDVHNITLECDDGFSSSSSNGSQYGLLGGHDDCTVRANAKIVTAYSYLRYAVSNGSGPSIQTPDWFNGGYWYVFSEIGEEYHNGTNADYPFTYSPTDFLVYFTMHFVQVYEHDLE